MIASQVKLEILIIQASVRPITELLVALGKTIAHINAPALQYSTHDTLGGNAICGRDAGFLSKGSRGAICANLRELSLLVGEPSVSARGEIASLCGKMMDARGRTDQELECSYIWWGAQGWDDNPSLVLRMSSEGVADVRIVL